MAKLENTLIDLNEIKKLCRFCMKPQPDMRLLTPEALSASGIQNMFEVITATQMDTSPLYSCFVCTVCKNNMQHFIEIRSDFLRVSRLWKTLLDKYSSTTTMPTNYKTSFKGEFVDDLDDKKNSVSNLDFTSMDVNITEETDCDLYENDKISYSSVEFTDQDFDNGHSVNVENEQNEHIENNSDDIKALISLKTVKRKRGRPRKTEASVLVCDICGAEVNSRNLLLRHMSTVHGARKTRTQSTTTTCHICGKTNLKRMAQHMRDHRKEDKFKCMHCPKRFNRHGMMLQHERQHTGERPFICEMCGFSFTSSAALKRHCKMHSLPDSNNKTYQKVQQTNRLRPVQTQPIPKLPPHQGIRPECPLCHNTYVNRVSIQRHMKLQHGAEGMAAWKKMLETTCMVCNEKFANNFELTQHKPIHIEHQCPICRRRFHSKITLDLHVKGHSKKARPFKCELCDATYPCSFTLKIHFRRAHTDERPFQCPHCGHGFVESSVLNAHMRKVHSIHGQLKPHKCTLCPEAFKSRDALRSHTEKHTGKYRYLCVMCQRNLHSGPQLAEHERIYHPGNLAVKVCTKTESKLDKIVVETTVVEED